MPDYKIQSLIDKQDNNEIIRDKIASVLQIEIDHQLDLARSQGKSTQPYDISVYAERVRPWEIQSDENGEEISEVPCVNVTFDSDNFSNPGSDVLGTQKVHGTFFIDCYAHVNASYDESGEKLASDELTSKDSDRVARIIRNILMADIYVYLGFNRGDIVTKRMITRREKIIPTDREGMYHETIIGTRLTLEVDYIENAPQTDGISMETVNFPSEDLGKE